MKAVFAVFCIIIGGPSSAFAGAPKQYVTCAACHGPEGVSPNPLWPNLAGQKKDYLEKQLKAFREGARKDPMMEPMVKQLSDSDIKELAEYLSGLKSN